MVPRAHGPGTLLILYLAADFLIGETLHGEPPR